MPYGICACEYLSDSDAGGLSVPEVRSEKEAITFVWTSKVWLAEVLVW